jgi:CTP synthase (UTP-ammonia lyase)
MEQNLHRILAEKLQLSSIPQLEGRLDLAMNGLEEKATMWNLCEGSVANEKVLAMLANGQEDLDTLGGISRSMIDWARMAFKLDGFQESVKIVIVGKYTGLQDSYLSVIKSLKVSLWLDYLILFLVIFQILRMSRFIPFSTQAWLLNESWI